MTQDTSTEAVSNDIEFLACNMSGVSLSDWSRISNRLTSLAAERDTLAKQAEDCARTCAEQAEKINRLSMAMRQVFAWSSEARPRYYETAILKIEEISEAVLKGDPLPTMDLEEMPDTIFAGISDGIGGWHEERDFVNSKEYVSAEKLAEARNAALDEALAKARQECPSVGPEGPTDLAHEAAYETAGGIIVAIEALKSEPAPRQSVQEAARVLLEWTGDYIPTVPKLAAVKAHLAHDNKTQPVAISAAWMAALQAIAQEAQGDAV